MKCFTFSSYPTIWFLPSLWFGVTICWLLIEKSKRIWMAYVVVALLWFVGIIMDPYKYLVLRSEALLSVYDCYIYVFATFRNGVFYASAYVLLGFIVAKKSEVPNLIKSVAGVFVFQLLFLAEAFFMKKMNPGSHTDMAIMMLPSVYFILMFLLNIDLKNSAFTILLRKYSMLIFLGQRLFLKAIPSVAPESFSLAIKALPQIEIYLIFSLATILFAVIIELLSRRFRFLNIIM